MCTAFALQFVWPLVVGFVARYVCASAFTQVVRKFMYSTSLHRIHGPSRIYNMLVDGRRLDIEGVFGEVRASGLAGGDVASFIYLYA